MFTRVQFAVMLLLIGAFARGQDQTEENLAALAELDRAREILEATETALGRDAMDLVEPLEQLARLLMAENQFDEADNMLDRAIQITRYHNGLHTPAQLSLITTRIDNFSNRQAWDDAREQMDYLFAYYLRVPVTLNSNLLEQFIYLAEQHIRGATEDSEIEQGRHLSRVYQLNQAMITTAIELYGEDSPLTAPYFYRQALHLYQVKKGHDAGGRDRTNSNLYYVLNGNSAGWSRLQYQRFCYEEGLQMLRRITEVFNELDPADPEGQAMSQLYLADWYMLFDRAGMATEIYETVYDTLLAIGVDKDQVASLFSQPRILPVPQFYPSVASALAGLPATMTGTAVGSGTGADNIAHQLSFVEWSADYPATRSASSRFSRADDDSVTLRYSFELPDENESTFLYKHRFRQTIGQATEVQLLEGHRYIRGEDGDNNDRLEQLRFRPKMIDGKPVASRNTLRYEMPASQ